MKLNAKSGANLFHVLNWFIEGTQSEPSDQTRLADSPPLCATSVAVQLAQLFGTVSVICLASRTTTERRTSHVSVAVD